MEPEPPPPTDAPPPPKAPPAPEAPPPIAERLLPDETVLRITSGFVAAGPALLALTDQRIIYYRAGAHGYEFCELALKKRPHVDFFERPEGWTVNVSHDMRTLALGGLDEPTAEELCTAIEGLVADQSAPWDAEAGPGSLWDEMRVFLDDGNRPTGPERAGHPPSPSVDDLQAAWVREGASASSSGWWPPSAATLAWVVPLLLAVWVIHTMTLATSELPGATTSTRALIERARAGDDGALGVLAIRLTSEKDTDRKVTIARLLSRNAPPGAADMIIQDLFSHDEPQVRRAEIEALMDLRLGTELVARLSRPGLLDQRRQLVDDLGEFGDHSVIPDLVRLYASAEPALRPHLIRALARLGDTAFLVRAFEEGDSAIRDRCVDAALSLPGETRSAILKELLGLETDPERRASLTTLLDVEHTRP